MNLSLSFIRGLIASINPCGFVLLPTYLMYFMGVSAANGEMQKAPISKALYVGSMVSAGFLAVFFTIGAVTQFWTQTLLDNAKYATLVIGILFIVLGVAMLFGFKLPIGTMQLDTGERDRTMRAMFLYGVAYAVASLGCTLPLFMTTLFQTGESKGYWAGVANVVMYALGMAVVVISLTLALAAANQGFVRWLKSKMQYVEMVSGAFVLLSGTYLLWYFYWVDVREESDPITDAVDRLQQRVQNWLNSNWQIVAVVLGGVILAGVAYAMMRERSKPAPSETPDTAPQDDLSHPVS